MSIDGKRMDGYPSVRVVLRPSGYVICRPHGLKKILARTKECCLDSRNRKICCSNENLCSNCVTKIFVSSGQSIEFRPSDFVKKCPFTIYNGEMKFIRTLRIMVMCFFIFRGGPPRGSPRGGRPMNYNYSNQA